jgi:hypothetical protein
LNQNTGLSNNFVMLAIKAGKVTGKIAELFETLDFLRFFSHKVDWTICVR